MPGPRIRSIKPEVWRDADFTACRRDSRLLFLGLISNADDEGRIAGTDPLIRGIVFPADSIPPKTFSAWLDELEAHGLIRRYIVLGKPYLDLPKWKKHQKIDRPAPSSYPSFEERDSTINRRTIDDHSHASRAPADRIGSERI